MRFIAGIKKLGSSFINRLSKIKCCESIPEEGKENKDELKPV